MAAKPKSSDTTRRTTRKNWHENMAWALWTYVLFIWLVPTTRAMRSTQLALTQKHVVVVQLMLIGWILLVPSAYLWRRGNFHGHLDGLICSLAILAVGIVLSVYVVPDWHGVLAPIPFSKF